MTTVNVNTENWDAEAPHVEKAAPPTGDNTTTYAYDGEGRHVKKDSDIDIKTNFVYDVVGTLPPSMPTRAERVAVSDLFKDPFGTTRMVADGSGTMMERLDYMPFGEEISAG